MTEDSPITATGKWVESAHASLCALGTHLRRIGFFAPLEEAVHETAQNRGRLVTG